MLMAITAGTLLGAAGIGAASSLLGGILGTSSQRSANETNLAIARETNAQNKELFNRQLAWSEDMWNKTNAYNSPANQVKLYQDAGVNPANVFGNGQSSVASAPSAPSAPQMQSATVNPVDYSWMNNIVDQGVNAYLNNNILSNNITRSSADAQIAKVEAEFRTNTLMASCTRILNDSRKSEYEKEQARMIMEIMEGTKDQQILQSKQLTQIQQKQYEQAIENIALSKLQQDSVRIANQYAPAMNEAQLRSYSANIAAAFAAARASDASALDSAAHAAVNEVAAAAGRLDNNQKKILFSTVKRTAEANARQVEEQAKKSAAQNRYGEFRYHYSGASKYDYETPKSVESSVKAYYAGKKAGRQGR